MLDSPVSSGYAVVIFSFLQLSDLSFRRKVVTFASISHIENVLTELAKASPLIDIYYDVTVTSITAGESNVRITSAGRTDINVPILAIADGARSHEQGALALLGVVKRKLSEPIHILAAHLSTTAMAGQLIVRGVPEEKTQYSACFGLKDEAVVYANVNPALVDGSEASLSEFTREAALKLGLQGELLDAPLLVPQQAEMVIDDSLPPSVAVLGDAAFSGTAIMGVYLNNGICDGVAFGQALRNQTPFKRTRLTDPVIMEMIYSERLVSSFFNRDHSLLAASRFGNDYFATLSRSLFRLRIGRFGLPRTLSINALEMMETATRGSSDYLPHPTLKKAARTTANILGVVSRTLNRA